MKKRPKIFISSTVHDLLDIRSGIKITLEKVYDFKVYSSNEKDFPILINKNSFEICLKRLLECNLVIVIIDKRFGGLYDSKKKISITQKEIRTAEKNNIPVWTFVRSNTYNERNKFNKYCQEYPSLSRESNFEKFKKDFSSDIQSHLVFDLISEITRFKKNNWIFNQFESFGDIYEIIEKQIIEFLKHFYKESFIGKDLDFDIAKDIALRSEKYLDFNIQTISTYMRLIKQGEIFKPRAIIELKEIEDNLFNVYTSDYAKRISDFVSSDRKDRLLVTDSTMETMNPDVWQSSKYHKRIIEASKKLARSLNLRSVKYQRIIILFDPIKAINDPTWINGLNYLINFHKKTNIALGICLYSKIPEFYDPSILNFYMVPKKFVAIWDPNTTMAYEYSVVNHKTLVSEFTEIYNQLIEICNKEDGGFWIKENLTSLQIIKKMTAMK